MDLRHPIAMSTNSTPCARQHPDIRRDHDDLQSTRKFTDDRKNEKQPMATALPRTVVDAAERYTKLP